MSRDRKFAWLFLLVAVLFGGLAAGSLLARRLAQAPGVPENGSYTINPLTPGHFLRYADMEPLALNAGGKTLSLQYEPFPQQSLQLFKNGLLQGGNIDFTTRANVITLLYPAAADDHFVAWYRY